MQELLEILSDIKPGINFEHETGLIDKGLLESLTIITIVSELNDAFDIEISVMDLIPENFNSAAAMMAMIERLQNEE